MLNYFKKILHKVSFDKSLFEKELKKAISSLIGEEVHELRQWCYEVFGSQYPSVLSRCFV